MSSPHHHPFPPSNSTTTAAPLKKKRRPAGTPDPDAEVVSLSPQTLLESDRYVCEICNQGFQRDQNLQMHRRRHKVPWKLLKREAGTVGAGEEQAVVRKRVYVCPEPSCLHHDPQHALGDLVGIKKHYRRKHSDRKQWVCERCSKGYAVQSDYKAHLKTCGTRGHTCDCGKVFSRVESFIEHQDSCFANNRSHHQNTQTSTPQTQYSLSPTASSPTPSTLTNFTSPPPPPPPLPTFFELQLLPPSTPPQPTTINSNNSPTSNCHEPYNNTIPQCLNLSLGPTNWANDRAQLTAQKAKREVELAEEEFAKAKKIRHQAQAELESAFILKDHAAKSINSILLQLTCQSCRVKVWPNPDDVSDKDPN